MRRLPSPMLRLLLPLAAFTLVATLSACTRTSPKATPDRAPEPGASVTYFKDVKPLLDSRCVSCHTEGDVAFSLEGPDAVLAKKAAVVGAIEARRMPVWPAAFGHELYRDDPSFDAAELDLIARWRDEGYALGVPADDPGPQGAALADLDSDATLSLLPGESAYLPNQELVDDYHCFVIPWTETTPKFMTGFQAVPGNREVVHHLVAYKVEPAMLPLLERMDADEDGAGYQCFGGAMPDRLYAPGVREQMAAEFPEAAPYLKRRAATWIGHWAPGMKGNLLPEGSGLPLSPGGAIVVQVHYYTQTAPNTADRGSEVRFTLADAVEKPGFVIPLSDDEWIDAEENRSLVVPPGGETSVGFGMPLRSLAKLGTSLLGLDLAVYTKMELQSVNLHMHSYGKSARALLKNGAGEEDVLLAIDDWNLAWQRDFTFVQPKVFSLVELPEDLELRVECTFANRTDHEVFGGLGSDEEMCFNFSFIAFGK